MKSIIVARILSINIIKFNINELIFKETIMVIIYLIFVYILCYNEKKETKLWQQKNQQKKHLLQKNNQS